MMKQTRNFFSALDQPSGDPIELPSSAKRFPDGAQILASAGKNLGARLPGMEQVFCALEDVRRTYDLGVRFNLLPINGSRGALLGHL
jgi:hypothetical protein